jgi:putative thioredoxin
MQAEPVVFEVGPGEFEQKVLAASAERPVLVDFWAEWCAPCRALTPVLEQVVQSYGGRAALAKLNVDEDPQTAARYGVRGIPAVKVFRNGEVAAEFVGALPEPEVRRVLWPVLPSETDDLVARGDRLIEQGKLDEAEAAFREAVQQDEGHTGALLRLGTLALEGGREHEARELLGRIEEDAPEHAAAQALLGRMELAETCREAGGREACRRRVEEAPEDLDARYDLACCLAAEGEHEAALEQFLLILAADRHYRDQAPREAMVRIFNLVGPRSDLANQYRRKLAGVLY